ncbi:mandelate racemase/muconate lactonizing enzyme family protein [Chelativorans sp. AA-79]|uniref:mandelate racemase/muconate lactonizing enzyme family protein n=1 Tax=Chelativorans sp. AA-79 TaxID=3028735 RepID=UPI0023FA06E5|nr:mandelate racemase/muconate lactonizing enzyme family protein [Chelativorans sp. AA-79]WEX12057.1 mandelate racemase/muconate lactonizing enzyme family protein [Chelativorans sp. AA-79]
MRIADVQSWVLRYPDSNDHGEWRLTVLARVETSDGVVGWGEGIAMWPEACRATKLLIDEAFAPLLIDAGDISVAESWRMMRAHCWWYGEGGIACFAYSALDMALWDIEGKLQGKPLYQLFGGKARDRMPAFAANHVNKATNQENIEEVLGFKQAGFQGVKLGFGKKGLSNIGRDPKNDVVFIRDLRAAVGSDFDIMVDIGHGVKWDRCTAINVIKQMAEYRIGWVEEPFHPTRIEAHRALKAAVDVPIAMGEREFTVGDYANLIETGVADVLGVDPGRVEGISGFLRVDELASRAGIAMNAHAWSTAITTSASLHLSIASPNTKLLELKPFPVSVQTELVDIPITQTDGFIAPPERPGLGIEVNEALVEKLDMARS